MVLIGIIFFLFVGSLWLMKKRQISFNIQVLVGLVAGIVLGAVLHNMEESVISQSIRWIGMIGDIYVRLLRMMVMPLIFVSIICSIIKQKSGKSLGKMTALVLICLLGTAAIAGAVGGLTALSFNLSSEGLQIGESESERTQYLEERSEEMMGLEETIAEIIPANPFYAMTGQGSSATLSVVLFACFLGVGLIGVRSYAPKHADFFEQLMDSLNKLVVEVVMMILMLTPFGILSLMTTTVAGSDYQSILRLAQFVLASYVAIFIMFIIHGLILMAFRLSPIVFYKKAMTALVFAFTSRTSAGTLPLTIRTLTEKMGVSHGIANLAASLGISIGQNGCAAIYPAMLVVMVAPTVGQEITLTFFLLMVVVITFTSIGIAGVGGGATFAGIAVLSALGLPVGIAGLLIAVEPLIDMARTALNVSDGMIAAVTTARITGEIDQNIYNDQTADFSEKPTPNIHLSDATE